MNALAKNTKAALLSLLLTGTAVCETPARGLPPEAPSAAELRYQRGVQLYRAGRYGEAVVEFRVGLSLYPDSPQLAFNYARALERSGDLEAAVAAYDDYGRRFPVDREEVARTAASLREVVAQRRPELHVTSHPAGASVFVDDAVTKSGDTPVTLRVTSGTHFVRFELANRLDVRRSIEVPTGGVSLAVELPPASGTLAPPALVVLVPAPIEVVPAADWQTWAGYGALGGAAVGVALGTLFLVQALDSADAAGNLDPNDRARHDKLSRDLDSENMLMVLSYAIGAGLAGGGAALLLWPRLDGMGAASVGPGGTGVEVRF